MAKELEALKTQLSNGPPADFFINRLFTDLDGAAEVNLKRILQENIDRYAHFPEISTKMEGGSDFNSILKTVMNIYPTFLLLVSFDFGNESEYYEYSKLLRSAGIASILNRKSDQDTFTRLFLEHLDPADNLDNLNQKISDVNQDKGYFPKLVFQDFLLLKEKYSNLKITQNRQELIETLYSFVGIKQLFIKYYFDLICNSKNDFSAQNIDVIFQTFFDTLEVKEANYWKNYKDGKKLKNQLHQSIDKDSPRNRHPELRKHIFDGIKTFCPVVQDGSARTTSENVRKLLARQLADYNSLSVAKLSLLMRTVQKSKGRNDVIYLLSQIVATDSQKLLLLHDLLMQDGIEPNKELLETIKFFARRLPRKEQAQLTSTSAAQMDTIYQTAESLRALDAGKKLRETEGKRGMTHEHVTRFLEERLEKLYARCKKEGALTQDQIPDYLSQFAQAAEPMIEIIAPDEQHQVIERFKESTNEILEGISEKGNLSEETIDKYKNKIEEKTEKLEAADVDERTNVVDEIGVTLAEASNEAEKERKLRIFLSKELIPYGLGDKANRISIGDFFGFPFGDRNGPDDEDPFEFHLRYLQLTVNEGKLKKSSFMKIFNALSHIPKYKYKKYFNIFPNDEFEETTFMAVYDLWQNKAFENLRIK